MSIWTEKSKETTSWSASGKETTSWSASGKETTAFRTLNTFKEIVFDSSYDDNYVFDEINLDNASKSSFNVKDLSFYTTSWTVA